MPGALADLKVLDFSTLLPGPMASLFLADAGAQVVKIERPGSGDEMRSYSPKFGADSVNFAMLNRGKRSIALDLKEPSSRDMLEPLLREADVLIEQFRPGVMARLGLGYDDVRKLNPDIIYCSISGYGQSGPKAQYAGHDLNYTADTGILALSHGSPDSPVLPATLIADIAGGTYPALLNILLALRARDAGQGGAFLDIAMADNLFPFAYWAMGNGQAAGDWPGNGDALTTGGSPRYQLYRTADGEMLAAAPLEPKFWNAFCNAVGLPDGLRDDTVDPEATRRAVANLIAAKSAAHWQQVFEQGDCCCNLVRSIRDALADPHFQQRGLFSRSLKDEDGVQIAALPSPVLPAFSDDQVNPTAPQLGADNHTFAHGWPVAAAQH